MKFIKIILWPLNKIIEIFIIRPLGLFIRYAYGDQFFEYKFAKPVMKIKNTQEKMNKMKYFEHETSFNVVISYCIINLITFVICYLISLNIIQLNNYNLYAAVIKFLKVLFKYDPIALMFFLITLVIYDRIFYIFLKRIHNMFVVIVQF